MYFGVELYFHIFITQYNYFYALKKNNMANVLGIFLDFHFFIRCDFCIASMSTFLSKFQGHLGFLILVYLELYFEVKDILVFL